MRKSIIITGLCCLTALSGCAAANDRDVYEESGNTINVMDRNDMYNQDGVKNNGEKMANFGYVRHQKNPTPGDMTTYNTYPKIDREEVADLISKICTQLPNVNDVATLVTDEEVLVVYQTDSEDRFETADQVKKSALSTVPRFYHVYVSDDQTMMRDIERFSRLDADARNVDQAITSTIKQMLKSPQGRRLSDGENENGEMEGGVNPEYERKMDDVPEHLKIPSMKNR